MQSYINSAKVIFVKSDTNDKIIALGLKRSTGKVDMRLHVLHADGSISEPIELSRSKLNYIDKLYDYISISKRELVSIKRNLENVWFTIPCLEQCDNIGIQRNGNKEITSFMGAICFDSKGLDLTKDIFANLPNFNGNKDNTISRINEYMCKNIKREIVLAHALSGAVCGIIDRNIILALIGLSSTGKTTIQKLGVSLFSQSDYNGTVLKWSATQNALIKRMDGLRGINILIDDTQLSKLKSFEEIIYSFENGQSIDRLVKGNELAKSSLWAVSIGITAEKSLLDTFKDLGAVARFIEIPVNENDLFDNEEEVHNIQNLYNNNYGVIGSEFVRALFKSFNTSELITYITDMGKILCNKYHDKMKEIENNNVLTRHLEGDIAIMISTATLANQFLGFKFNIEKLETTLFDICKGNYYTFDENKFENVIIREVYDELLSNGKAHCFINERNDSIVIPAKLMKSILLKYSEILHVKSAKIKEELSRQGLLEEKDGTYCHNYTVHGKNVTGYKLLIKEEG